MGRDSGGDDSEVGEGAGLSIGRAGVRARLKKELPTEDLLGAFLIDRFPGVAQELASGMSRTRRVNELLERESPEDIEKALDEWVAQQRADGKPAVQARRMSETPAVEASPRDSLLLGIRSRVESVRSFLTYYLGTQDKPVPFGGRDAELDLLDGWLAKDGLPCFLLTAPAGRGKSALLLNWVLRLAERKDVAVAYYPISVRFETQVASDILGALCERLAFLQGEDEAQDASGLTYQELRGLFIQRLRQAVPSGRQLVVVIDGLDEATGLDLNVTLFPTPPPGLRIVVAAREGAGGRSEQDYCYALGWEEGRAHTQPLDRLHHVEDVASILDSSGLPTDELSNLQHDRVLHELLKRGEGEPFLIRELIRELQQKKVPSSGLISYLQQCEPGFPALMDRWWKEQQKSLREGTLEKYRALLDILCAAYGALHRADLQELLPDVFSGSQRLDDGLAALGRFIVETEGPAGRGYVFNHPKLSNHFWGQLSKREQDALDARFVHYGTRILDEIARGSRKPGQVPRYVLHHLGAHLARSAQGLDRQMALVSKQWYDAWVAAGSEVGFLSDVQRGLDAATTLNQNAVERHALAPELLHELRCALIANTMRSRAGSLDAQLLRALVERGKWSPAQALAHLCQADAGDLAITLGKHVVECLHALSPYLSRELLRKAADFTLLFLKHEDAEPLESLIPRLVELDPGYLKVLLSTLPAWARARFHRTAARLTQGAVREVHLDEAEKACDELSAYPGSQVWGYRDLAQSAPERQDELLPKLVEAARRLPGLAVRFANLAQTYERWPTAEVVNALQDTIALLPLSGLSQSEIDTILFDAHRLPDPMVEDILRALGNEADAPAALLHMYQGGNFSDEHRARLLRGASKLPHASRQRLQNLVLDEISACMWPHGLNRLIAVALALGTDEDKASALDRVNQLRKEPTRSYGRALLAAVLPECERLAALRAALRFLEPEEWQRECVNSLVPLLTEDEAAVAVMVLMSEAHPLLRRDYALLLANEEEVAEEARAALRALAQQAEESVREEPPEWRRRIEEALALFPVDSLRAREALASAVAHADQSEAPWSVCSVLQTVLSGAPGDAAKRAVWGHIRHYYENGSVRLMEHSLKRVLAGLPADLHAECVKVAVAGARSQQGDRDLLWLRAYVREAEADSLLDEALACARGLGDEYAQVRLCIALADSIEEQRALLGAIKARIETPGNRLDLLLLHLRPRVVPGLLPDLLDAAIVEIDSLPPDNPRRISWTAGVLESLDPDKRMRLIASAWEMMARFLARHRATMSIPGDGIYPQGTSHKQGDEISALVHDGPRLAKYLTEEQLRELLAGLPTRSAFIWSRVSLIDALSEPDRTAQLRIEFKRARGLDPDDSMRITSLALVAAHLPAGPEREDAIGTVLDAIEQDRGQGDRHQARVQHLWHLAGVLHAEHADRIFAILNAAGVSVGAVTHFPSLLAAMSESLRLALGERLFRSGSSLSQDLQERLRAHLVGSVSSSQLELSLQAAIRRPEQSVLKALGSVGPRLSDQQLPRVTEALCKLQAQHSGGTELLEVLTSLILEQKQRGLSWRPAAYGVLRTTLHQRHRHRGDMLHALAAQGPALLALLKAFCVDPAQAIALVLEVGSTWP